MMRSRPASALGTVVRVADQSETTTPGNSHSALSSWRSSVWLAVIVAPLTEL